MAFKVGDRVRIVADPDNDAAGFLGDEYASRTYSVVESDYAGDLKYPICVAPEGDSLDRYWGRESQFALAADPQPAQTHDYMLGYAAGYNHPGYVDGQLTVGPNGSAQYRAGFLAGWDASAAEDREDVAAALLS